MKWLSKFRLWLSIRRTELRRQGLLRKMRKNPFGSKMIEAYRRYLKKELK